MSTRRTRADAGFCNPASLPKGPNGKALCRYCENEVTGRRQSFCSDLCVHEWKLRTQPRYARAKVWERDRGKCALCPTQFASPQGRWDVDHIKPVVEGGGECGLENLRTLCRPCHKRVTAELASRRAEQRGNGDATKRPELIHVEKAGSDEDRGLWFWQHASESGRVHLSNVPTNFTPNWCGKHDFAFDSAICPACVDVPPAGMRITGHESGVLLLHLVCGDCDTLSDGYPYDKAAEMHESEIYPLHDGWQKRREDGAFFYLCPACKSKRNENDRKEKDTITMASKKKNGASANAAAGAVGTKEIEVKIALDPSVLEFKRNKLIDVEREIDKLTAKKRDVAAEWTGKLKEARETRKALLDEIESGRQTMTVRVVEEPDYRRNCMIVRRADTNAVVDERPMSGAERQLDIERTIKQNQEKQAAAAAETPAKADKPGKGAKPEASAEKPKRGRKPKATQAEATA